MADSRFDPARFDFSSLRIFCSTGEAWTPEAWHWLFERIGAKRVPIINFTGGTEMGGIITSVVTAADQAMLVHAAGAGHGCRDPGRGGACRGPGEVGELVMRRAPIGLTQGLWRDEARYLESYWSRYPGAWHHGDFAMRDADGYYYVLGRSDDTLKIAGKRTGPSEIEALLLGTGLVREAAAVGVPDPVKGMAIVCVCALRPGVVEAEARDALVGGRGREAWVSRSARRRSCSSTDLPKTRNMKIMRRVVRAALLGEDPGDLSSLVNPEAVEALVARAKG